MTVQQQPEDLKQVLRPVPTTLDYGTPPPPRPTRWDALLFFVAFLLSGLAFLISLGGYSQGFVEGERLRVSVLIILSVPCISVACFCLRSDRRVDADSARLCWTGLIFAFLSIVTSAYFCLA